MARSIPSPSFPHFLLLLFLHLFLLPSPALSILFLLFLLPPPLPPLAPISVGQCSNIIMSNAESMYVWVHYLITFRSLAVLSHPLQKATLSHCVVALCSITGISVHVTLQVNIIPTYECTSIIIIMLPVDNYNTTKYKISTITIQVHNEFL